MSIDSGFTGRRREKASRCRVRPVPRATARRMASKTRGLGVAAGHALEQLQAAREHRQQVVEVVRDAAGQLAERFHLLRLAQRRLGVPQPLLIAQALGDVVDELVGADAVAVAIPQRVETHLVGAPVARRIAELFDRRELLAGQRPAPHRLHGALMVGLRRQQVEHVVADPRTNAEDALELVGRRVVDGQPSIVEVRRPGRRRRCLRRCPPGSCARRAPRSPGARASRSARAAPAPRALSASSPSTAQNMPATFAALVADRRIGEREPGLLVVPLAVHDERKVLAVGGLARHRGIDQRADVRPDLRPDVVEPPAERAAGAWRRGSRRTDRYRGSRAPAPTPRTSGTATAAAARRQCAATAASGWADQAATWTSRGRASAHPRRRHRRGTREPDSSLTGPRPDSNPSVRHVSIVTPRRGGLTSVRRDSHGARAISPLRAPARR